MTHSTPPSVPRAVLRRQSIGQWLLAATVLASALLVGSMLTMSLCLVTASLAIANFLLWFEVEGSRARPVAGVLLGLSVLLTAFTALQCLPLPVSLLATIAPESADVWARALRPLQEAGPAMGTVSLEPIATRVQVLRGVAYALAFLAALRVAWRRDGTAFLLNVIATCSLVMAVTALIHPVFGVQKVLWIYAPADSASIATRHIAPLLNANHLASYVNVGLCVALAGAIAPRPSAARPILAVVFLVLLGVEVWIASRGGLLGAALGVAIVVGMTRAVQSGANARAVGLLALAAVAVTGTAICVVSSAPDAWQELADADVSKIAIAEEGLRLARLFPWLGVGRGAFEVAFPAVRTTPGYLVFTHPENVGVQWITEWGAPVALLAFAALVYALRPAAVLARSRPPVGAWAALVAVGVHNLVDFNLEVPGVVILLTLCAATVTGGSGGGAGRSLLSTWAVRTSRVAVAGGAVAAIAIALVIPGMGHELREDRLALHDRALDPAMKREAFRPIVRAALARHPAEPYLPFLGALRAARAKDESLLPWIARTLERAPVYGPAHLLLAQSLYARSPSQARLEYRIALEQDTSTGEYFRAEAPGLVRSFDDAMELVPEREMRAAAIVRLIDPLRDRLPATAIRLDQELARIAPGFPDPSRRAAQAALADLREGDAAPWCATNRPACVALALKAADGLRGRTPETCEGYLARARVLVESGDVKRGLDELDEASGRVQDGGNCLHALIDLARELHEDARVSAGLDRLTRAGCATDEECVTNLSYAARIEIERGNPRRALSFYKRAYERSPNDELLIAEAQLAARVGLHAEALDDFAKLAQQHPGDARWPAQIAAEREALARATAR